MFLGARERCGVREYAQTLVSAMAPLADVIPVTGTFARLGWREYRKQGAALNAGEIAHVQHAYAFWGGLAPHRAGFLPFVRAIRVPLVLTVHELDDAATGMAGLPPFLERAYKRLFNRLVFASPRIRALIVHTPGLERALRALGVPPERIRRMPMPVPQVNRALGSRQRRCSLFVAGSWLERTTNNEQRTAPFIVTIFGFLARRKGYDIAFDAMLRLPETVTLWIAGDAHPADTSGPRRWLEEQVAARGLVDRVRFLGYVPDEEIPTVMAASDLVLAPFTAMSASASIHLALAHGRPVLASDLEANRELPPLALFPSGNPEALASAIEALRGDPDRREALAEAALTYARDHGPDRLARDTVALYQEILSRAHRH
jgi:glycosyltransferase involved in cell wall biosynthesis